MATKLPISKQHWAEKVFQAKIARRRGIMRRSVVSVARYCDLAIFKGVAARHDYHLEGYGDHYLIVPDEVGRWRT